MKLILGKDANELYFTPWVVEEQNTQFKGYIANAVVIRTIV